VNFSQKLATVKVTDPSHGVLAFNSDGSFTYTPTANYHGTDSFTYKANDGTADSNVATVAITINSANHAPVVANQSITTTVGTPITITFKASDADGNPLTYTISTPPTKGILSGSGDSRLYTPNPNANGVDSFAVQVCDNAVPPLCTTAQINLTIIALPKAFLPLVKK